jgi:hypothetical protein
MKFSGGTMENKKPICKFESNEQFWDCLRYWQSRLFLDHWIIKATLVPSEMKSDDGKILEGRNFLTPQSGCAYIEVCQDDKEDGAVEKHCEELTLVHELLHCKYAYFEDTEPTLESAWYETMEHKKLHEMARTLLMVKYDVGLDWFKNF